jgi:hypothetical protein
VADIIINFRSTFINPKNGLEVFNNKQIILNYLLHWRFFTDVLSIVPFELFYELATKNKSSKGFKIFDLLKLIRLLRLGRIISYLKLKQNVKIGFRIGLLILMFLLFSHWITCISFMVV